jgi:hypothetical protein
MGMGEAMSRLWRGDRADLCNAVSRALIHSELATVPSARHGADFRETQSAQPQGGGNHQKSAAVEAS